MPKSSVNTTLPLCSYRLHFSYRQPLKLPAYAGSAWRGAFGHTLKRVVCVARNTACEACMLRSTCVYTYIFETPPPPDAEKMRCYPAAPHPFVIMPQDHRRPEGEDRYVLGLTLIGNGNRYLPYVIHSLKEAGEQGIGGNRQRFLLAGVEQYDGSGKWSPIYQENQPLKALAESAMVHSEMPDSITIHLLTPLRIIREGRNIGADQFRFADLFGSLLRRISMLSYFHTDKPLETDFAGLMERSRVIEIERKSLKWRDWTRYSSRQKTEIKMGGLVGELEISGDGLEPFWPYLWLGQWTHAGKGATMGLGGYRIESASLPAMTGE